jgi:hypothetical protein
VDLGRAGWGAREVATGRREAAGWGVRLRPGQSWGRGTRPRRRAEEGARTGAVLSKAAELHGDISRGARLGELRRWMGKRGGAGGCWVEGPPREGWMSLPGRRRRSRWRLELGREEVAVGVGGETLILT